MCYHLISRVAHRAFYLDAYEPFARRASVRPRGAFAAADISPDGEGLEGIGMKLLHHSYSTNGVSPSSHPNSRSIVIPFDDDDDDDDEKKN
jgi:hypothetical protein